MLNILLYARKLEQAGVPRDQAEIHMSVIAEIVEDSMTVKQDIRDLRNLIVESEYRIVIKLGVTMGAMFTIALAIIALMIRA